MTLYNNRLIPYWMRIDRTYTETIDEKHTGRKDSEWGIVRISHPEGAEFHLQEKEEFESKELQNYQNKELFNE